LKQKQITKTNPELKSADVAAADWAANSLKNINQTQEYSKPAQEFDTRKSDKE